MKTNKKREKLGFKQAIEYVLDLLCFSYYVKGDNLVSDKTFDELEKLYIRIFKHKTAPMRGIESKYGYTTGVQHIYFSIKQKEKNEKIQ